MGAAMKVLVTGVGGQLGYDVVRELEARGHMAIGVNHQTMDITDAAVVDRVIRENAPDAVIHCAAYTAVDAAEDDEEQCSRVNVDGTRNIAEVCKSLDIKMIYISTDYVFSGQGERPWEPGDEREPQNVYGRTKCEGEFVVQNLLEKYFIVRVTWIYGINGKNFVKTMLKLSETHDTLRVVDDQIGSPTYTLDLAVLLANMVETEKYGIYHATNEGTCSWHEFACAIFEEAGLGEKITVLPVSSKEYGAKAPRPYNSRMSNEKLVKNGFHRLPTWQDALKRYLEVLKMDSGVR